MNNTYEQMIDALDRLYQKETTPERAKALLDELIAETIKEQPIFTPAEEKKINKSLEELVLELNQISIDDIDF